MNNRNGKEIIQEPQSPSSHSARNDIMRPFKLQKLQTPIMETTLQFHEHISYHGESSSNGGHTDHSGPAKQQQTPNQSFFNTTEQQQTPQRNTQEEPFFYYQESYVQVSIKTCQNSVIGKFLSNKIISLQQIQNSLNGIWGKPVGFKIVELEGKTYQFIMDKAEDTQRILKGNPWIVRNIWLVVHPWDRKTLPKELDFTNVPLWIQLWGLPMHCRSAEMGKAIGDQVGVVQDSAAYEMPDKANFVKIKVLFNINNPIRAGMYIGNKVDGINWIDFRYENLPMFCFYCGLVGHNEENCSQKREEDPDNTREGTNPRGAWLRSNNYGRRLVERKEKTFRSNPRNSLSGGLFSPIPKGLSDMMADLTVQQDKQGENFTEHTGQARNDQQHSWTNPNTTLQTIKLKRKHTAANRICLSFEETKDSDLIMAGLDNKASQGRCGSSLGTAEG